MSILQKKWCAVLFLMLFLSSTNGLLSKEYIESFHSDITINSNGSLVIQETILYHNKDIQGLHGFVRSLPIRYKGAYGTDYKVPFVIKEVLRNKKPVPYHTKQGLQELKVYIGSKDTILSPGKYRYVITYHTDRQLGFFETYDELYWNITGQSRSFPIQRASCTIVTPAPHILKAGAWTGKRGEQHKKFHLSTNNNTVHIHTTQPLASDEGITASIKWPKGYVDEPTDWERFVRWAHDNTPLIVMACILLLLFVYYVQMYFFIRKNNNQTIIPIFHPPAKFTPGGIHYFLTYSYNPLQLAAETVHLAVQQYLTIHHKKSLFQSIYTLKKTNEEPLSRSFTKSLLNKMFESQDTLTLSQNRALTLEKIAKFLTHKYKKTISDKYFVHNYHLSVIPGIVAIGINVLFFIFYPNLPLTAPATIGITLITILVVAGGSQLLKTYTSSGFSRYREIVGFKMFLQTTETERLKVIGSPPTKTPELYEKYLPYAIALRVEKQWTEQFASVFQKLKQAGKPYQPVWHSGPGRHSSFNAENFTSTVRNSLQSSSSTTGSGSQGSSGGGRGGGSMGSW